MSFYTTPTDDVAGRFNGAGPARKWKGKKHKPLPTRAEIDKAVDEYLRNGGRITRLEIDEDTPLAPQNYGHDQVDEFLMGP